MNLETLSLSQLKPSSYFAEYNYTCYNGDMSNQYTNKSKYKEKVSTIVDDGYREIPFSSEHFVDRSGNVTSIYMYPEVKKQATDLKGYKKTMVKRNGKQFFALVHRLVAITFMGNPPGKEVDHIDGDKSNNHVSNLEWVTSKENEKRKRTRLGIDYSGENNFHAKLKWKDVDTIRSLWATGKYTQREIGNKFGISQSHTQAICRFRRWATK